MPSPRRTHIVLVPGFVGFDALGQLRYYEGLTNVFDAWRKAAPSVRASLHYFDNFPTAAVELRAKRLGSFLAKRLDRGEFEAGDRIALVGHSTGGLDIRKLLFDLANTPDRSIPTDTGCAVEYGRLLAGIDRIGFLSVPHYGTNLGDIASDARLPFQLHFRAAAWGIALNREPLSEFTRLLWRHFEGSRSDLLLALSDVLNESDEDRHAPLARKVSELEARSELGLWLSHMSKDFRVIRDLRSDTGEIEKSESPAHFAPPARQAELARFRQGIETLSFATIVPRDKVPISPSARRWATALRVGSRAPSWTAAAAFPPVVLGLLGELNRSPTLLLDVCRALCADSAGNFENPNCIAQGSIAKTVRDFSTDEAVATDGLSTSDSDGVVNTLSMLWPQDESQPNRHTIYLVEADHGDIVGHYRRRAIPEPRDTDRRYASYDIFQSPFVLSEATFRLVWERVFDFCVS